MALPMRSLKAMASIVRSSVRTKSGTEQVAEPSSDRAMRFNLSPEQADPPSSCSLQACLTPPVEDSVRSDLRLMLRLGPDQNMMLPPSLLVTLSLRIAQCFSRWVASTWEPSRLQRGPYTGRGAKPAGLVGDRTRSFNWRSPAAPVAG